MATALLVVAAFLVGALVASVAVAYRLRILARSDAEVAPERMETCSGCYQDVPASEAVNVASEIHTPDDPSGFGGGAMIAHYHPRCAPKP